MLVHITREELERDARMPRVNTITSILGGAAALNIGLCIANIGNSLSPIAYSMVAGSLAVGALAYHENEVSEIPNDSANRPLIHLPHKHLSQ